MFVSIQYDINSGAAPDSFILHLTGVQTQLQEIRISMGGSASLREKCHAHRAYGQGKKFQNVKEHYIKTSDDALGSIRAMGG